MRALMARGLPATLIAAALLAAAVGCTRQDDTSTRIALTRASIDRGELGAATLELGNVLQRDPQDVAARLLLAEVSLASGRAAAAERHLRLARGNGAGNEAVLPLLGRALLAQGQFRQLLNEAQLGEASLATRLDVLSLRGQAHLGLGETAQAEAMFRNGLAIDSADIDAQVGMARVRAVLGAPAEAEKSLRRLIDQAPFSVLAHQALGALLFDLGRIAEAEQWYVDAIEMAADLSEADALMLSRIGLIECQRRLGKRDKALVNISDLLAEYPWHPLPKYLRAIIAFEDGNYADAIEKLESVISVHPQHRPSLQLIAAANFAQGRLGTAEMRLGDALEMAPGDNSMLRLLADTYLRMGNAEQAVATVEQIPSGASDPGLLELRGTAYLHAGRTPQALDYLRDAVRLGDNTRTLEIRLAAALLNAGRIREADALMGTWPTDSTTEQARTILRLARFQRDTSPRRAVDYAKRRRRSDPSDLHALLALAEAAEFSMQREQAKRWLDIARERNPDAIEPRILLASYAEREGDYDALFTLARESLVLQPYNDTVLAFLGEAQLASGHLSLALATYREALRVSPALSRNALNLVRAELAASNYPRARDLLVASSDPDRSRYELIAGVVVEEHRRGNEEQAFDLARAVQSRYRRSPIGFELAGDLQMLTGDYAAATASYESALRLNGDRRTAIKAYVAASASRRNSTLRPLQQWLEVQPGDRQIERIVRSANGQSES